MNFRNKILAGLLVLQLILVVVVFWENDESPVEESSLLPGIGVEQVERFLITDNDGKILDIRKVNDAWQVEIEKGVWYSADIEKVKAMIAKLVNLKSSRLVTRTKGSHKRLKVSDDTFIRSLQLSGKDVGPAILYLGTAPNHKSIHVRTSGDDNVYLVRDFSSWEVQAEAGSWWQTSYVDLNSEMLLEVRLQNENGEFLLTRSDNKSAWQLEDGSQSLNEEQLNNFLDDVSLLSVTEILSPSAPKPGEKPLATLNLTSDKKKIELKIWDREDENSDYLVKSSDTSFYAMAGRYAIDDILEFTETDLIKDPLKKD